MLSIPLFTFLIIYFVFLLIFTVFFLINLLHIVLTGTTTFAGFIVTLLVIGLSAFVIFETWSALQNTDWTQPIIISLHL